MHVYPLNFHFVHLQKYSNYHRALIWTAVMATISHVDPAFSNVVAIQAVNEQIMDASKTPGYGDCEFFRNKYFFY